MYYQTVKKQKISICVHWECLHHNHRNEKCPQKKQRMKNCQMRPE